jgi:hypothetical protein
MCLMFCSSLLSVSIFDATRRLERKTPTAQETSKQTPTPPSNRTQTDRDSGHKFHQLEPKPSWKEEPAKRTRDTADERKKIYRHLCCGSSSLSFTGGVDGFPEIIGALILRSYAKPLGVSTHELLLVQLTNLPYPNLLAQPCAPGQHTQTPTLCTVAPPPLTIHVTQTAPA